MTTHTMKYRDVTGDTVSMQFNGASVKITALNASGYLQSGSMPCSLEKWTEGFARVSKQGNLVSYETKTI